MWVTKDPYKTGRRPTVPMIKEETDTKGQNGVGWG